MKHQGKVVIVTGAAQGLGYACAERFVREGASVLLVDVQEELVKAKAEAFGEYGAWWAGDLANVSASMAGEIVDAAITRFGKVDILVSNAGILHSADFVDFPEDVFDRQQRINVKAPFLLGQAVAKAMIEQGGGGSIINMSSINAILANPNAVGYAVSKGGIKQLTAVMAVALIPHGIRVNAIGPGTILTDLSKSVINSNPLARKMMLSRTPQGRFGEPSEVASVASFLASDDASYIVGQTIYPDGGRLVLNYVVPVDE